jgi:uncharacterized protein (TIGR02147 family)
MNRRSFEYLTKPTGDGMVGLQEALREQYLELRARNPKFSLRAYARRLKVNSGVLSAVMNGSRPVTPKFLNQIIPRMGLPPEKECQVQGDFKLKHLSRAEVSANKAIMLLRADEFNLISDPLHFSILSLFELQDFEPKAEWMSKRLKAPLREVRAALERLQRLELVRKQKGGWQTTGKVLRTSEGISDMAIKRFHEQRLEEAKAALFEIDVHDRDYLCSTVAINRRKIPLARKLVREFLEKLEEVLGEDPKDEVYRVGIEIFPVSGLKRGQK